MGLPLVWDLGTWVLGYLGTWDLGTWGLGDLGRIFFSHSPILSTLPAFPTLPHLSLPKPHTPHTPYSRATANI
ncbi:MAG: hypothetical protein F6J93_19145 [Oscillatoria sp. SIO1A7]|nr:hypothetical protein [Oscillatoria sp. SIO1A7]